MNLDWVLERALQVKLKVKLKLKTEILTLRKIQDMNFSKGMTLEKVTDPETREIIHHNEAPLSDHYGHGSAKFKKNKEGDQDT